MSDRGPRLSLLEKMLLRVRRLTSLLATFLPVGGIIFFTLFLAGVFAKSTDVTYDEVMSVAPRGDHRDDKAYGKTIPIIHYTIPPPIGDYFVEDKKKVLEKWPKTMKNNSKPKDFLYFQFIDEILKMRGRKEFANTWKECLKGLGFRRPEKALDKKRKEYDYLYTNIFRKYEIVHDDLNSDLDRMWSDAIELGKKEFLKYAFTTVPFPAATAAEYEAVWNKYMESTIEYARRVGEGGRTRT